MFIKKNIGRPVNSIMTNLRRTNDNEYQKGKVSKDVPELD
jgi:hypothetical protein